MKPSLAERVARDKWINAGVIRKEVREWKRDPDGWKERGTEKDCLHELKLLWYVLARYE